MAEGGGFDLDADALARAEAALSALADDYLAWVRADLDRLVRALAGLRAAGAAQWQAALGQVFSVAHDIKGQAGTFGYPLLTLLGAELCRLAHGAAAVDRAVLARAEALAAAMAQVVSERLSGDGGEAGRILLARLEVQPALHSAQD